MKMRKQLSLLLVTALVATVAMTGCSGGRKTTETKQTEVVTTTE